MEVAHINGLVLAGGYSTRLGEDKGLIDYYGMPHRDYLLRLIRPFTACTWLSMRRGQQPDSPHPVLYDAFPDMGPFSGVLTAVHYNTCSAWLTVACDFPLIDADAIRELVDARDPRRIATCFAEPGTGLPEPLLTIWEPAGGKVLRDMFNTGQRSMMEILKHGNVKLVIPSRPEVLWNANTPEQVAEMKKRIAARPVQIQA
jgi:molybdopterin-guanine dinucleotide biosynthesis protein A